VVVKDSLQVVLKWKEGVSSRFHYSNLQFILRHKNETRRAIDSTWKGMRRKEAEIKSLHGHAFVQSFVRHHPMETRMPACYFYANNNGKKKKKEAFGSLFPIYYCCITAFLQNYSSQIQIQDDARCSHHWLFL